MNPSTATTPPDPVPTTATAQSKNKLSIDSFDDMRKVVAISQGIDPNQSQIVNDFLKMDSKVERTNLPTRADVQGIAYLQYASRTLFPNKPNNPFSEAVDCYSEAFMAKGGEKSKQLVDILRGTPDLASLQAVAALDQKTGLVDRIMGRSKTE